MNRWLFASGLLALALWDANVVHAQGLAQPVLQFAGTSTYQANGRVFTRYNLIVANWQAYPDPMFQWLTNGADPCRTHVTIRNEKGKQVYGFTGLLRAQDLTGLGFATEVGKLPPRAVYIELHDRVLNIKYVSNPIQLR
jgi:hypothetical protein